MNKRKVYMTPDEQIEELETLRRIAEDANRDVSHVFGVAYRMTRDARNGHGDIVDDPDVVAAVLAKVDDWVVTGLDEILDMVMDTQDRMAGVHWYDGMTDTDRKEARGLLSKIRSLNKETWLDIQGMLRDFNKIHRLPLKGM